MEEKVKEIVECCICTDLFTDPRMLPCIHTFCLKCLNDTIRIAQLKAGDSMPCPICRSPFVIPEEGIAALKKNFFIERLLEAFKIQKPEVEKPKLCDVCIEDSNEGAIEIPKAIQFCTQCQKHICERCCRDHKRYQELRHHQLVNFGSPLKKELAKTSRPITQYCRQHSKMELEQYCFKCEQAICMKCFETKHVSHRCSDIRKAADGFKEEIGKSLNEMNSVSQKVLEKSHQIESEQNEFHVRVENAEKAIIKRGNELKEIIDECTKSLLDELASINQQGLKELEMEKEELERHRISVDSLVLYYDQLISKGSPADICRSASDLRSRNEDVQRHVHQHIQKPLPVTEITFDASKLEKYLETENIVGVVNMNSNELTLELSDNYIPVTIQSKNELDISPWTPRSHESIIAGVTKMQNRICILTSNPNLILVFEDETPFHFKKKIQLKNITQPDDIASSERSRRIFILDSSTRSVWTLTTYNNQLTKWLSDVDGLLIVSFPADDHLLVLRGEGSSSQLEIYGSDEKLIRHVKFPLSIVDLYQCIEKHNGEFVVSHGDRKVGCGMISLVSSDGQIIIRQFQPDDRSESWNDSSYLYFCPVTEDGSMFAADDFNHRISVFDAESLQLKQILLKRKEDEEFEPCRLFYDSNKKQLLVACYKQRSLNVYKLIT